MDAELSVIGSGPAGLSAAIESAKYGVRVELIDENILPGGQLFKQIHKFFGSKKHYAGVRGYDIGWRLLREAEDAKVNIRLNTTVWGIFQSSNNRIGLFDQQRVFFSKPKRLVIATGATENPLSFPGSTLPGVMGAGAVQTMMNIHRVLPGRRVLMVGAGNVGLIVSYQLLQAGAEVAAVVEAMPKIGGYLVHALKLMRTGVPILTSHTVLEARGDKEVESAVIASLDKDCRIVKGSEKELDVDLVCLAVGLKPDAELCRMLGCGFTYVPFLGGRVPIHNEDMETTIPGVYVAGDVSGVEEASVAMEEGRLAGISVAESLGYISEGEAEKEKDEIKERLRDFRIGPFGSPRQEGKDKILTEYKRWFSNEGKRDS
ncbi:MAG: FAD-dependent oxidoreductase [Candidatus Bathyarchaeia archaeon]|nr:FAD-dependent oxidoreductase [Candidatus Bathyarchaeota archaeon]